MSEYLVRSFASREAVNAYLTTRQEQSQMARSDWQRAFRQPITRLNSIIDGALNGLGVNLDKCWEEISCVAGGKVRNVGINWGIEGKQQEIKVSDSRINDEAARLEIRIRYPDRSGPKTRYEWEVYTLSLQYDSSEIVVVADDRGEWERVVLEVSQMPVLYLQVSEAPRNRLGLDVKFFDYDIRQLMRAKRNFIEGINQVCQVLKEPDVEVIP